MFIVAFLIHDLSIQFSISWYNIPILDFSIHLRMPEHWMQANSHDYNVVWKLDTLDFGVNLIARKTKTLLR